MLWKKNLVCDLPGRSWPDPSQYLSFAIILFYLHFGVCFLPEIIPVISRGFLMTRKNGAQQADSCSCSGNISACAGFSAVFFSLRYFKKKTRLCRNWQIPPPSVSPSFAHLGSAQLQEILGKGIMIVYRQTFAVWWEI